MKKSRGIALRGVVNQILNPVVLAILAAVVLAACDRDLAGFTDPETPNGNSARYYIDYGHWGALYPHEYTLSKALVYAIQDEDLAQAEYQDVINRFGDYCPFRCIVQAEADHIAALTPLFEQIGEPVPPNEAAPYVIPAQSWTHALQIGVLAESLNIAMYELLLRRSDLPANFRTIFTDLKNASICHKRAFSRRQGDGESEVRADAAYAEPCGVPGCEFEHAASR